MGQITDEMMIRDAMILLPPRAREALERRLKMTLNTLAVRTYGKMVAKGFYGDGGKQVRNVGELMMLVVTELAEAFEEYRAGRQLTEIYFKTDKEGRQKPEGFPIELADVIIRVCDTAAANGIDLERCVAMKEEYNDGRPHKHGKIC